MPGMGQAWRPAGQSETGREVNERFECPDGLGGGGLQQKLSPSQDQLLLQVGGGGFGWLGAQHPRPWCQYQLLPGHCFPGGGPGELGGPPLGRQQVLEGYLERSWRNNATGNQKIKLTRIRYFCTSGGCNSCYHHPSYSRCRK